MDPDGAEAHMSLASLELSALRRRVVTDICRLHRDVDGAYMSTVAWKFG